MKERLSGLSRSRPPITLPPSTDWPVGNFPSRQRVDLTGNPETIWLRIGPDMEESFFDVITDLIFEQPQQFLGPVLQRAYKMELLEGTPS